MRSASSRTRLILLSSLAVVAVGSGALYWHARTLPKRFAAVEEGRLYRCGTVTPHQLEHLKGEYGVRTVLSLLNPEAPESIEEQAAAERLGLRWINVPLPGDGASTPADREEIRRVITDPDAGPLLVHCAAGTNRTGLAIGMHRIHSQDWTVDQVLDEMRRFDFEDLPKHENLRQALTAEWQLAHSPPPATQSASQPASP